MKMCEHFRISSQYPATLSEGGASPGLHRDKPKDNQFDNPASIDDDLAEEDVPKSDLHECRSKSKILWKFCFEHSSTSRNTKCLMMSQW